MRNRDEIVGIVLAAGLSSRMGKFKQLLPIGDEPAVYRIAGVLKQCLEQVVVVVGHRADEVRDALAGLEVECLHNRGFRDGMLSSVQCAVREVGPGRDYLFCLGEGHLNLLFLDFQLKKNRFCKVYMLFQNKQLQLHFEHECVQ